MDPPYNQRQYGANYSPLNYIAHYDKDIVLNGKTALMANYNKSDFCKKTEVTKTFETLVEGIRCKWLIISYNNEGLIPINEFKNILLKKGNVKMYKIKYNKFKAHQNVDKKFVEEYVWVVNTAVVTNSIVEIEMEMVK
jgi:adenine-specific DNA-methyltransferase